MLGRIRELAMFTERVCASAMTSRARGIIPGKGCHMGDDSGKPPLARRVPGANLRATAVPPPRPPALSDAVLQRVHAAVEGERAWPGHPTPQPVSSRQLRRTAKSADDVPPQPE